MRRPRLSVDPFTTAGASGAWRVRWLITNNGDQPILLRSALHPHSQFRTPDTPIDREIAPGASAAIELPVQFSERPGVRVENPFLILRFRETAEWRLLARVPVTAGPNGEPVAEPSVVVTTQPVRAP